MNPLFPLLLLCLTLTTPGWAGDYWKLSNDTQPLPSNLSLMDAPMIYCGSGPVPSGMIDGKCSVSAGLGHSQDPCLAKMEAAMRANDGHLAVAYLDGTGRIPSPGYTAKGKAEFERDYQQWDAAKRDCFRDKP